MFKLGVITDEISQDVKKAVDISKELGLDCIELRGCWNKNIKDLTNIEIRKIRNLTNLAGLEVVCLASPLFKCNLTTKAEVQEHLGFLPRLAEIAKLINTEIIRGFAFWSVENPEKHWKSMVEKLSEAAYICEKEGLTFALENEAPTILGTGKETRAAVEEVNSKALKLVWDPGNSFLTDEVPYPDGYLQARDYMVHMHLKDGVRDERTGNVRFVAVGSGEIDYEGQFKALIEDGYEGCVSIETHYKINNDKEKGSRETYTGLQSLLKKLDIR
jgi:sugar phosphate isomerase/epimerase